MGAVVKFNPDAVSKKQFEDAKEDRIDILSRKVKAMEANIERMAENVNKLDFSVKTNSELIETLNEKAQMIAEATCDNFNKTEERIEGMETYISSVKSDIKMLDEKVSVSGSSAVDIRQTQPAQKEVVTDSDDKFWTERISEAYSLTSRYSRKKKVEVAHIFAGRYGYGEEFWMDILGLIWSGRRQKKPAEEIAADLNNRYTLKLKSLVDISATEATPTATETAPSTDSFLDILKAMGYEVLDSDVRYTVKDSSGRTCEVSRKAFEASMNDIFTIKKEVV